MIGLTLRTSLIALGAAAFLTACESNPADTNNTGTSDTNSAASTQETVSQRFNAWLEEAWEANVARSPELQTFLGRKTNYGDWADASDAYAQETHDLYMARYQDMLDTFNRDDLDTAAQLSYDIFVYQAEQQKAGFEYRNHWYEFNQFTAPHSSVPAFMINQHRINDESDAEAYISRLRGMRTKMYQHIEIAQSQVSAGVAPPRWAYAQMIDTARNAITGIPFQEDAEEPSTLLADFTKKISALELAEGRREELLAAATEALKTSVQPAYEAIIAMLVRHRGKATADDGAWKLPNGEAYYAYRLNAMTTTDLTADQIHDLGLSEMARIHGEMRAIMETVGFEGSLQEFFVFMRTDDQFYLPDTDEGRAEYLALATSLIDGMRTRLDDLFKVKPKAELVVKRVEQFRERSAGKAFYQRPAADGSRPGTYYANLYDMRSMPTYQAEALAYHEGIPGHHMQIAIQQELEDVPSFRRFSGVTAYSEGWGLYSEFIPKEIGFYEDPYSDFGRLAMELWRAARLVVDTGLHHKKWTRQEAIDYLIENTPNPEADCVKAIERYIVMPGQATAYKIGMLKILELRAKAQTALGDAFDIRDFHDAVLKNGPVPLAILESLVDGYIAKAKAG